MKLESGLCAQIGVRAIRWPAGADCRSAVRHVVSDSVNTNRSHAAESDAEADVAFNAVVVSALVLFDFDQRLAGRDIRLIASVPADHTTSADVEGGDARDREAVADAGGDW